MNCIIVFTAFFIQFNAFYSILFNRDYNATLSESPSKDKSVSIIHQRNLQLVATETSETKNELNQILWKNYSHLKTWTTVFEIIHF